MATLGGIGADSSRVARVVPFTFTITLHTTEGKTFANILLIKFLLPLFVGIAKFYKPFSELCKSGG